ncbi:tetraacyldisaccharide 4'-kinase [Sphingobacterium sp. LRF_L2]|uniref:tetraacyldisaccharide 4'-kinase n=1 Tax=Sphingobacterium sp. LRF_L2 TaxID=3369421 RepID=UPI003F5DFA34
MITFFRWLLLPFALCYATIVWIRNRLYDIGLLKSTSFDFPVIVIGNLAVGGTGKSPMTEYILRTIKPYLKVAILSRGYGRKTKGFRYVEENDISDYTGDEPLQIKKKYPETTVVVCEDRVKAIKKINQGCDAVLLDDAYQHRSLKPSFSILLFDYNSLLEKALPLPTGNFRDTLSESKRANTIVITKCPNTLNEELKTKIIKKISNYSKAPLFFSKISYKNIIQPNGKDLTDFDLKNTIVFLFTGIANPVPLYDYLKLQVKELHYIAFSDHHDFSEEDKKNILKNFQNISADNKILLTTEKDIQRLASSFVSAYNVHYIPIETEILFNQAEKFNNLLFDAFHIVN